MKISLFGTGYVGLVSGVCFAELGNDVVCADIDSAKIETLDRGATSIFEPGLKERLDRGSKEKRLTFTTDLAKATAQSDLLFICVGTPSRDDGTVDLSYIESVARSIGTYLDKEKVIINKSTVPVGSAERVRAVIEEELARRNVDIPFHVVSNPEFLREGAAVNDFFNPDRVVIGLERDAAGVEDAFARAAMERLYQSVARTGRPIVFTDIRSAELIKYASNAMLATRISFMNQLSLYCEAVGADITAVSKGMGLDTRIGPRFLHAGIGYGGSCFPKDVRGLIRSIKEAGTDASIFVAVHEANEAQKRSVFPKVRKVLGSLAGKRVALWGLSFKPKTDDIRESAAKTIAQWLLDNGAHVSAFDPEASENFKKEFPRIQYAQNAYDAAQGADLLILCTEWDEFRNPDWERIASLMRAKHLIDGRNIYRGYRADLKKLGFTYSCVGMRED